MGKMPVDLPSKKVLMGKLKLARNPVVVMLGGSDFGLKLAKGLHRIAHKFDEEFIVFGSHKQLKPAENFRHIRFAPDFLEYLKVSKAVITLGGQKMLAEFFAFSYGSDSVIIPLAIFFLNFCVYHLFYTGT